MAKRASVPKFGAWENQNAGYTVYFENVRHDKTTGPKFINPNDPEEMENVFAPTPIHSHATGPKPNPNRPSPEPRRQQEYQQNRSPQRMNNNHNNYNYGNNNNYQAEGSYGAPPARPRPNHAPKRPTAVPKFGDWEAVNSNPAGGYTVQFENLKKKKEEAKATPIRIPVEPERIPQRNPYHHKERSFFERLFGCFMH